MFVPRDPYDLLKEDPVAFEYFYLQVSCLSLFFRSVKAEQQLYVRDFKILNSDYDNLQFSIKTMHEKCLLPHLRQSKEIKLFVDKNVKPFTVSESNEWWLIFSKVFTKTL